MDKKTLSIVSLVCGILTCVVALFYFIQTIITLTNFSGDATAKANFYIAFLAVIFALAAVGFGIVGYFIIKAYLDKKDYDKMILPALIYFCYEAVACFMAMCFWGFDSAKAWVTIILGIAGIIIILLPKLSKLDGKTSQVLVLVAIVLALVLSIVGLVYAGGLSIATYIFTMLLFIALFIYYLFVMIGSNNKTANE
ncbi:MAG: hypothetical protein IKP77_01090 [Acholeplasmatales bacterium]|nr:hypothetical protein [Acholeplasmatales bacterium]